MKTERNAALTVLWLVPALLALCMGGTPGFAQVADEQIPQPVAREDASRPAGPVEEAQAGEARRLAPYRIGVGDVLSLEIFEVPSMSRTVRVLADGAFSLPLLGRVAVAGMTVPEAQAAIEGLLTARGLVIEPQVTLFVEEFFSQGVSILGAVGRPGRYQLTVDRTLLRLISLAGGATERAGGRILIVRMGAAGEGRSYQIEAEQLLVEGDPALNISLRPGDTVMIPPAKRATVYVSGAVSRPGAVEFDRDAGLTLLQAVIQAGAVPERKGAGGVTLIRQTGDETPETVKIDLEPIWSGAVSAPVLRPDDVVLVGEL